MDHRGRTALVTGGSRGIGAAIAARLAREGLRVAIWGRDARALDEVAAQTGATPFVVDLTSASARETALAATTDAMGAIDVLVNNAGIATSAPLAKVTDEAWSRTFAINVEAPFALCRAVMPAMASRGWGRVINVASNAGLTGYAYTSAYCASKHAVVGLTRALAAEFARAGVTINAICPGFVDTDMASRAVNNISQSTGRDAADARKALEQLSPQRRLMTADEVAHAVFALIPHEARGIHGQAIALDGGQVLA